MRRALQALLRFEPGEGRPLLWSFLYGFLAFTSYQVVKPIREAKGIQQGVENLELLFLVNLGVMLVAHLAFAALVSRFPRRRVVPILYRVIGASLLLFAVAFAASDPAESVWLARAFYVWVSVYNLFAMSVFWVMMADSFRPAQAVRLFPVLTASVSLGGLVGAGLTSLLVDRIGAAWLIVIAVVLLEGALVCVAGVRRVTTAVTAAPEDEERGSVLRGALEGLERIGRSRYLLAICLFLLLYSFTSSVIYFERANIVDAEVAGEAAQISLFAKLEATVQALALVGQLFVAGRIIRSIGVTAALALLPLLTIGGFLALGGWLSLGVVLALDVTRRALNYAITRPCREVLFTALDRAEKYKAKSFIDTFVYRGGDTLAAFLFRLLRESLSLAGVALAAVPVAVLWLLTALRIGSLRSQVDSE